MKRILSADIIFSVSQPPIKNGYIIVDETGTILETGNDNAIKPTEIYSGAIIPGMFNAHCHLENSGIFLNEIHGLPDFISKLRNNAFYEFPNNEAMKSIDKQMAEEGIVFCGDISNSSATIQIKKHSKITYHTFLEIFGLNVEKCEHFFSTGLKLKNQFIDSGLHCSLAPHSSYSLSSELIEILAKYISEIEQLTSIHFMESLKEKQPHLLGMEILNKLKTSNIQIKSPFETLNHFLQLFFQKINPSTRILFVHAIYSDLTMLKLIRNQLNDSWFCVCPTSNFNIERKMMKNSCLNFVKEKLLIGTDGQASNEKMSLLEEMKSLQENSSLSFQQILKCATMQAAEFFTVNHKYGSIVKGKQPGLVLISPFNTSEELLLKESKAMRIV